MSIKILSLCSHFARRDPNKLHVGWLVCLANKSIWQERVIVGGGNSVYRQKGKSSLWRAVMHLKKLRVEEYEVLGDLDIIIIGHVSASRSKCILFMCCHRARQVPCFRCDHPNPAPSHKVQEKLHDGTITEIRTQFACDTTPKTQRVEKL
jgi:hypothetical protein